MRKVSLAFVSLVGVAFTWAGCSQNAATVQVRSLERSGKAAFLCLRTNKPVDFPGQPLEGCFSVASPVGADDYSIPHTIALVTQTTRGEVAVVDVTSGAVADANKTIPGFNFLPVGQQPSAIVATPGSSAAFVSVADPLRPGIFAISSSHLLPSQEPADAGRVPTLSSLAACALPDGGSPSDMVLVGDMTKSATDVGGYRAACSATAPVSNASPSPAFSLENETPLYGRQKLVVALPARGELVVIDAQNLLAREPGTFQACDIEATISLRDDRPPSGPGAPPLDAAASVAEGASSASDPGDAGFADGAAVVDANGAPSDGGVCARGVGPALSDGSTLPPADPHPLALALADDGRLFVSDDQASVIHVVDVADPCAATILPPLLPVSAAEPWRRVITGAIAVSPLVSSTMGDRTAKKDKRFVYAVDVKDNGSVMIFDVSRDSTTRTPLSRPDVQFNPFEPPDRLALGSSVKDLTFATHELPVAGPDGVLRREVIGNANPDPPVENDLAYKYRPPSDLVSAGAGPRTLRGTFAFLALSNGQVAVVDVDDYDADFRRPENSDSELLGCTPRVMGEESEYPLASQEASCRVVERHRVRSAAYFSNNSSLRRAPTMQAPPIFYDQDKTVRSIDPKNGGELLPRMLGPNLDNVGINARGLVASLSGSNEFSKVASDLNANPTQAKSNWVAFDLREPRAHVGQTWSVVYEGRLPRWAQGSQGRLQCAADKSAIACETDADPSHFDLYDSSAAFCDSGAEGADLAAAQGIASGDVVEILSDFPDLNDPYWTTVAGTCSRSECEIEYGLADKPVRGTGAAPSSGRDLVVEKAYQDHLALRPHERTSSAKKKPVACCFPYPIRYTVRAGKQWIVTGSVTGFAHHVLPDPSQPDPSIAACVLSCDRNLALRNGRAAGRRSTMPVLAFGEEGVFRSAQLQFVVWEPKELDPSSRDSLFQFDEGGGFSLMSISLGTTSLVLPQSIRYVPGLDRLAIPDAVAQGLLLFNPGSLSVTQALF